ncbi:MAG: biotin--[acetyl-CoA-carboxylase] ligase [Planctomycetota bacterium]|jgi:BirA family biotin operon repressor/biotin-[acetyl-CoA-carboxylase] ligase
MEMVQEQVLEAFLNEFRPFPEGLRPDTICQRTGIGPDALPAIRARLAADGFVFEDDEDGRWRLADKPDRLWPYWVRAGLRCDRLGTQVYYREEVESTQDIAFELMVEGRPHGTLVIAEHQTGGRGRADRHWHSSPYQSLLFSLLLDLEPRDTFASVLTIAISTAVARAIQDVAGVPAHIKFPNDILVRGKKVAGILLEVRDYGVPARAVAGVGINVNQLHKDLHKDVRAIATSLREERPEKEPLHRARLLRYILRGLENWLEHISQDDYTELEDAWKRFSGMEGKEVRFLHGGEEISGRILDVTMREGLLVRPAGGKERRFRLEHLADVRFE